MNNKIVLFDIVIMILTIIFLLLLELGNILSLSMDKIWYFFIFCCIYTSIKCISGIILFIISRMKNIESLYSKKYILLLLPSFVLSFPYSFLIIFKVLIIIFYIWGEINHGYITSHLFPISLILSIIKTIGIIMWLINLTFYEKNIKIINLVISNILILIIMINIIYLIIIFSMQ